MANFIYDSAREKFLNGEISWLDDEFRVALVKYGQYTGDTSAEQNHKSLADIESTSILKISQPLSDKTSLKGLAYSAPVVLTNVQPGEVGSIIIFKQGISNLQSYLIAHMDTYLKTTSVDDVTIQWNTTGNKIFKL